MYSDFMQNFVPPSLLALLFACGVALSDDRSSTPNPIDLLSIPKPEAGGSWERVVTGESLGSGLLSERWRWTPLRPSDMSPTIIVDFRRQTPPPPPAEVARAFQRAADRTSYANSISDRSLPDGGQWVEYALPMQGERGFKKIMQAEGGVLTLTLASSDKFDPTSGSYDAVLWKSLQDSLRNATVAADSTPGSTDARGN